MGLMQLDIRQTASPVANMKRRECLEAVNGLGDKEIKNLLKLVKSDSARRYLKNDLKFAMLEKFIP